MTPLAQMKRNEIKEYFETNPLWMVDYERDWSELTPEKVIRITKKFVYVTDDKKYTTQAIYKSEEECWEKITDKMAQQVNKIEAVVDALERLESMKVRLNEIYEDKPHLLL